MIFGFTILLMLWLICKLPLCAHAETDNDRPL
jgi:hypothetical protein